MREKLITCKLLLLFLARVSEYGELNNHPKEHQQQVGLSYIVVDDEETHLT